MAEAELRGFLGGARTSSTTSLEALSASVLQLTPLTSFLNSIMCKQYADVLELSSNFQNAIRNSSERTTQILDVPARLLLGGSWAESSEAHPPGTAEIISKRTEYP